MKTFCLSLAIIGLTFMLLPGAGLAQETGRRLPPARLEIADQDAFARLAKGDRFTIRATATALTEVKELQVQIEPDKRVKLLSGEPLCIARNVAAGGSVNCEVAAQLLEPQGLVTVFYGTVMNYGSIGDSQEITVGTGN